MWIITKDFYGDIPESVGGHSEGYDAERFASADTRSIRLLNNESGGVEYQGRATYKRILNSPKELTIEIQNWALADTECTELQYYENDKWLTL